MVKEPVSTTPVGVWLHEQCEKRKLSYRAASLYAGLGHGTIHSIIRGKRNPDPDTCRKLADFFGVTHDYVLELAGHRTPLPSKDALQREMLYFFNQLSNDRQKEALRYVQWLAEQEKLRKSEESKG